MRDPSSTWILLLLFVLVAPCISTGQNWYKGNLHTHSFWSDGDDFPEMIMLWYKKQGYHFVALTDHNILQEGEKWVSIANDSLYRSVFQKYINQYGEEWVTHKEEEGALKVKLKTLDMYRPLFEEDGRFMILKGQEITDKYNGKHLHLNASHLEELIEPQHGNSVIEVLQNNIDAVLEQRRRKGTPMIVHINHPNFHYSISLSDMIALEGERFFEVFNGHPQVHNRGDDDHMSTEEMWDQINLAYLRNGKPLIFGLGTDDSHHYHRKGKQWSNAGRGWVMVEADTLTPSAIIRGLEKGQFYASTGVILQKYEHNKNKIRIKLEAEKDIRYSIQFIGVLDGDSEPGILKEVQGTRASFRVTSEHLFVRAKITSSKKHFNPVEDLIHEMAWTQPVIFQDN